MGPTFQDEQCQPLSTHYCSVTIIGNFHSPTHRPLSAHHCVLVGQGPLPQRTIYFNQPLSAYVHNDEIGRKPPIADDIYHYPE